MTSSKYNIDWLKKEIENGTSLKYLFFWGHNSNGIDKVGNWCLSQWYESPFIVDGTSYKTTEHWMMSQKALLFHDIQQHEKIIASKKPGEAKDLGRQVRRFDEDIWAEKRYEIVRIGNVHKFSQNLELREYLINTNNRILVEASPVDQIWGVGLSKETQEINNVYSWRGLNQLGFALMEVRDFLRDSPNSIQKAAEYKD